MEYDIKAPDGNIYVVNGPDDDDTGAAAYLEKIWNKDPSKLKGMLKVNEAIPPKPEEGLREGTIKALTFARDRAQEAAANTAPGTKQDKHLKMVESFNRQLSQVPGEPKILNSLAFDNATMDGRSIRGIQNNYIRQFVPNDPKLTAMLQMPVGSLKEEGQRLLANRLRNKASAEATLIPETTPLGFIRGAGETALEAVTGLPTMVAAGYAGMYALAFGGQDLDAAIGIMEEVQKRGTYEVESEEGKMVSEVLSYIPEKVDAFTTSMGNEAMAAGANPMLATSIKVGGDLATMLIPGKIATIGIGRVKKRLKKRAIDKADKESASKKDAAANAEFIEGRKPPVLYKFDNKPPTIEEFSKTYLTELEEPPKLTNAEERSTFREEVSTAYKQKVARTQLANDILYRLEMERIKYGLEDAPAEPAPYQPIVTPRRRDILSDTISSTSKVLASVVTVLDNIHPALAQGIRQMEFNIESKMVGRNETLKDFYELSEQMYKGKRGDNWHKAYLAQDWDSMKALSIEEGIKLKSGGTITSSLKDLKEVMNDMGRDATSVKFKGFKLIRDYIPRSMSIANYKSLVKQGKIKGKQKQDVEAILAKHADDETARHDALGKVLLGGASKLVNRPVPGSSKRRLVWDVKDDVANSYEPVHIATKRYVDDMTEGVEIRRFLGEDKDSIDLSVQSFVDRVSKDKNMSPRDINNLRVALSARFTDGRKHANPVIQSIKNFGYIETIGNVWSALTQMGDVAAGMTYMGIRSTATGVGQAISGKGIKPIDIGYEQIMKEMASPSKSSRVLASTLKWSGFASMDRFGKTVIVNASRDRHKRLMKSDKGREDIRSKYQDLLGEETEQFMRDLATGDIENPNVRFAIFNDLADLQPITMSDMPIKYLQNPNLRIMYALKTWSAHQLNTLYRRTINESKRGSSRQAAANLLKYSAFTYALGNVGVNTFKDLMAKTIAGEDLTAEDIDENFVNGMYQTVMVSKYSIDKNRGDVWGVAADITQPALVSVGSSIARSLSKDSIEMEDLVRYVPIVGPAIAAVNRAKE